MNVRWSRTITQNRLTHIVTACGEGSLDIMHIIGFGIFSSASGRLRRAHACGTGASPGTPILRWRLRKPLRTPSSSTLERAGPLDGFGYARTGRSHYDALRVPGSDAGGPPDPRHGPARNHGGVRGAGPNPQSRKREAKPQCTHPHRILTPARAGTANEITARFRFSKRKNISLMR